ncbi:unnamed protein product [Rotaria sp. Silwood1]|nr:unnamed protein product [Rotaria sp. Silwood1]
MIDFFNINHPNFTFDELHRLRVTSHEVLLWSSSIDLAERYQYYIDQPIKSNRLNEQFFNCTPPWFGSRCQYSFELVSNFAETTFNIQWKSHTTEAITYRTCYILLECDRGVASMCLDWREICDGRIDCFNDGVDESQCFELEINECNENENRCHNGLCIPKTFWDGDYGEAECLDKSDLLVMPDCPDTYLQVDMFGCAEYACRPDEGRFPCGDGQCVEDFGKCQNGRHLLLTESLSVQGNLPYDCWIAMVCLSKIIDQVNEISCKQFVNLSQILPRLETCEYPIQFPTIPVLLAHVRFLYHPKQIFNISVELALLPNYVCYDEQLCDFLTPTFRHGNMTCRYGHEMGLGSDVKIGVIYYLAILQQIESVNISTTIGPAQRCVPFQELFSSELLALPRIHRLKSYHVPCQNYVNLQCFIDESYMCLCTVEHHSNCFSTD